MAMHTVKQLARISGVSVRTLHYYDQIGLLQPAKVGANGYRYYGQSELLRLQQILLHRELGLPLSAIGALLDSSDRGRVDTLRKHRQQLMERADRYRVLIATVDQTIASLEGAKSVSAKHLYRGFSPQKQAEYEDWIVNRYGADEPSRKILRDDIVRSRNHVGGFSPEQFTARSQVLADLEAALAAHCMRQTADSDPDLLSLLARHREWVAGMWGKPCSADAYAGLAGLYESHPDFRARNEQLAPGLADYLPAAMRAYSRTAST